MAKESKPWADVREWANDAEKQSHIHGISPVAKSIAHLLTDADKLRAVALLVDDMLEPGQIWSVNPTKLQKVRQAVEALPKRLLNG